MSHMSPHGGHRDFKKWGPNPMLMQKFKFKNKKEKIQNQKINITKGGS